ncbi:HNH endonuclease [Spiroplasma cantharicola]|uniref:5-methylcytosine-specific restriction enzyme A n=1 Tax=Spiroplasma cantharicola TaxID=362837 RepID=A0A0M4JX29_9MOLU|nr:HNH endonuclease signature motif containing protein [Spiroplasma cantharicola]ALD66605.1 5-methylcytosine-specific restriction enzyme A [Spiroplasma cantharicola]
MQKQQKIDKWQAPGNSKIFNYDFCDIKNKNTYTRDRTIYILIFFKERKSIELNKFLEKELISFLIKNMDNFDKNDSNVRHFWKPLLFYGFLKLIKRTNKKYIELSFEGKRFIDEYSKGNFEMAKENFIYSLLKVSYPNEATKEVKLSLFPFRILFRIFLEKKNISKREMEYSIPYIKNSSDLQNLLINNFEKEEKYDKFCTWVINSLVDLNILDLDGKNYSLPDSIISYVSNYIDVKDDLKIYFFECENENVYIDKLNYVNYSKIKRDLKLVKQTYERDQYKCFFSKDHFSFYTEDGNMYLEAHHIVPISLAPVYKINLDLLDNMVSLCPNCHKSMHYSENENKYKMLQIIKKFESDFFRKNNYLIEDIEDIYISNLYLGRK